jgi:hypothetical protein
MYNASFCPRLYDGFFQKKLPLHPTDGGSVASRDDGHVPFSQAGSTRLTPRCTPRPLEVTSWPDPARSSRAREISSPNLDSSGGRGKESIQRRREGAESHGGDRQARNRQIRLGKGVIRPDHPGTERCWLPSPVDITVSSPSRHKPQWLLRPDHRDRKCRGELFRPGRSASLRSAQGYKRGEAGQLTEELAVVGAEPGGARADLL